MKDKHVILIVDDQHKNVELLEAYLVPEGYAIITAAGGEEALEKLSSGKIDLILLDVMMPGMNGFEVIRRIRQDDAHQLLPIILVTALRETEDRVLGIEAGCDDFISKPFNKTELLARVSSLIKIKDYNDTLSTYRHELERAKVDTEAALEYAENIINTIREPLVVLDKDLRVVSTSSSFNKFFQVKPEETIGQLIYNLGDGQWDIPELRELLETILPAKTTFNGYEVEHDFADIGRRTMLLNARQIEREEGKERIILLAIEDITERRQLETLLEESEKQYRRLFETANDGILLLDKQKGKIIQANPAIGTMLGCSQEDLIGNYLKDVGFPEEVGTIQDILLILERDGVLHINEAKVQMKTHQLIDADIYMVDRALLVQCNVRDITARKEAELEREKLQQQLVQAQKIEAIGTLAGGIAHDFNNILTAIIGYTQLAQLKLKADVHIKDYLEGVLTAGIRAKDLVSQILTFSSQSQKELKPVQIGLIVQEALKLIRSSFPATIDICQKIDSEALVLSDATQIHQVVMNLCTNAAHAMQKDGGILEVILTDVELDNTFCAIYPDLQPGMYQRLTVNDTGRGMTAEIMSRIFDPFFTTKPKDEGTGLGLSVVHGIVKDFGGIIRVYSELSKGTNFTLYFPIINDRSGDKPAASTIIPSGTERILVVDDEKAIIDVMQTILTHLGYAVEARASSLEALELFKAMPDKFDLVITDMTMPQMTGDKLARELMKIRPDVPVILCSGFSENITKEKAGAMGIKAYLMKPLLKNEMAQTIRMVLDVVED